MSSSPDRMQRDEVKDVQVNTAEGVDTQGKLILIEEELNQTYAERKEVIRGLMVGMVAREHVLLLGPPGTAKSELTEDICSRVQGNYFRWLLSRTSAPEELLGPISLTSLEQDRYKRVPTGKLPEANVAFLDEIFKSNSAILNGLLSILNERLFFNDGQAEEVPIEMIVGASNELPSEREELSALWDRFMLRFKVDRIREDGAFEDLLRGAYMPQQRTIIDLEELRNAQEMAAKIAVDDTIEKLMDVREALAKKNIFSSDRRYMKCLSIIRANAYLNGRDRAEDEDVNVLAAALWEEPDDMKVVRAEVYRSVNPVTQYAEDVFGDLNEIIDPLIENKSDDLAQAKEAVIKAKNATNQIEKMIDKNKSKVSAKRLERAEEILKEITRKSEILIDNCMDNIERNS